MTNGVREITFVDGPVARMERSEIRDSGSCGPDPGLRCAPSGLRPRVGCGKTLPCSGADNRL